MRELTTRDGELEPGNDDSVYAQIGDRRFTVERSSAERPDATFQTEQ
ncbi:MAG: hypothetical protein M3076_00435 [Actinomycetota bacterium]|nr:hypothetical protein [Actinomycetota bacterium]